MQGHFTLDGGGNSDVTRRFSVSTVPSNLSGAAAADLTKSKCRGADVILGVVDCTSGAVAL
jgi:hypothetical protein